MKVEDYGMEKLEACEMKKINGGSILDSAINVRNYLFGLGVWTAILGSLFSRMLKSQTS